MIATASGNPLRNITEIPHKHGTFCQVSILSLLLLQFINSLLISQDNPQHLQDTVLAIIWDLSQEEWLLGVPTSCRHEWDLSGSCNEFSEEGNGQNIVCVKSNSVPLLQMSRFKGGCLIFQHLDVYLLAGIEEFIFDYRLSSSHR